MTTVCGSHGHDVPVTLHGGIAFSLASHYTAAVYSVLDHASSVEFSFADTISAAGSSFFFEMGATIQGGSIHAAEGNATLLGSSSIPEFGDLLFGAASAAHSTGVDTIFGGIASHLTPSDLGSVAANMVSTFARAAGETIGGSVHSVTGGPAMAPGGKATISFVEPHQVPSHIVKFD